LQTSGNRRKNGARQFEWRRGKNVVFFVSSKNDPKHKRFEKLNSNKKQVEII
jgi:hypothetical protein